jgi:uncharacterized protein (TIGR03083 family)
MDYSDHVAALARESADLVAALRAAPQGGPVPSCPDWDVRGLAEHVGQTTGFWTDIVCDGCGVPKTGGVAPPTDDAELADWAQARLDDLTGRLRSLPADAPCWSWLEDQQNVAFVARRWANETAIHRIDAQLAAGDARPIDGELAVDGIEEVLMMAAALRERRGFEPIELDGPVSLHLHAHDRADQGDGEWVVTLRPDGFDVERSHAKADLGLQGAAGDLELLLYHRPAVGEVAMFGDRSVLDTWYRFFTF